MEPYQAPLESSRLGETIINGARIFTDTDSNTCKVLKITF
jgi:hypothetical protein